MSDITDVIAAFADGEPVDPAGLTDALSQAEGREHLIDLLALRDLVGDPDVGARKEKTSEVFIENRRRASVFGIRRILATAALVVLGVIGGFLAGHRLAASPGPGPATTAANTAPQIVPVSAPSPTRIIRLENGVDWNERGGGN